MAWARFFIDLGMEDARQITLKTSKLRRLSADHEQTAAAVNLRYVHADDAGILRMGTAGNFSYALGGKEIADETILARIEALVIPPAWTNVWICKIPNGHLQATGFDTKNRKQYRYHPLWNASRNLTKFAHMLDFGEALPAIKRRLQKDMSLPGLPLNKVLATIVSLMQ